jgi:hypothetical protein
MYINKKFAVKFNCNNCPRVTRGRFCAQLYVYRVRSVFCNDYVYISLAWAALDKKKLTSKKLDIRKAGGIWVDMAGDGSGGALF